MCHESMTRDQQLYFSSERSHTQDFYALKKSTPAGFEPANLRSSGKYDNHWANWVDSEYHHDNKYDRGDRVALT